MPSRTWAVQSADGQAYTIHGGAYE